MTLCRAHSSADRHTTDCVSATSAADEWRTYTCLRHLLYVPSSACLSRNFSCNQQLALDKSYMPHKHFACGIGWQNSSWSGSAPVVNSAELSVSPSLIVPPTISSHTHLLGKLENWFRTITKVQPALKIGMTISYMAIHIQVGRQQIAGACNVDR